MNTFIFWLTVLFVIANVLTRYLRRNTDGYLQQPMSAYLTGRYSPIQDAGFFGLSVALALLAYITPGPLWLWQIPLYCAGAALVGVVVTKLVQLGKSGVLYQDLEDAHLACAAIAFACVTLAELSKSWDTPLAIWPAAAMVAATLFTLLKRTETTVLELLYSALIVAWLLVYLK